MTLSSTHFAVLTSPVPGHLNPVQVLGAELVRRGARVTVVHVQGVERFRTEARVGFASFATPATGGGLDAYLRMLGRPRGVIGLPRMIRATAMMTDALLEGAPATLRRIGATAVLADAVEPAGPLVAAHLGLPHVEAVTGLPLLAEADVPPPFLGWRYRGDAIGRFRNRGGYAVSNRLLRPIDRVLEQRRAAWRLTAPIPEPLIQVAQCPRRLDYPRSELPSTFRYGAPWRQDETVELDRRGDDRPLIFCSLGTLQGARLRLIAAMSAACARIGARAVIAHAGGLDPAQITSLPGDPLVRSWWPQTAILRHCSAAMVHGGFNTVVDALAAELPMVLLPIAFEQPATAARVARIGAGKVLSPRWPGVGRLAGALADVLEQPSFRQAASRIAADIRHHGGVTAAADAIADAVAADRRRNG